MTPLFDRLRRDAGADWDAYVGHAFVEALGRGTLPAACFRHYLAQDYLFLVQFARAYALAAFKSDTLADLRSASATLSALLDVEMPLHVTYCAGWGVDAAMLEAADEALETIAYTRFVHERGVAGDRLDLEVALAPCVLGYAAIGARLGAVAIDASHPYAAWIAAYSGDAYQAVARAASATLDRLWHGHGGENRYPALLRSFRQATRLETAFWSMGYAAAEAPL